MATVSFNLPESIEQQLRAQLGDLSAAAKEAALVELYRQGQLTQHQVATALGITRLEVDGVLKRHNVTEDLITPAEFEAQMATLRKLLDK
ncbi:MAG TPA: UPF0175 family protein [Pirellulales bacterium]|jgi:predicted XRE-type DNA-binding protein|nr:UPF0175 family protein [Pirellulales bacterium]